MSPTCGPEEPRARFAAARVARLASVRPDGSPHLVPVSFALVGDDQVVFAVDSKPKSTVHLQRLANIAAEPRVSFLVDRYDDDWYALWWVRADGVARVLDGTAGTTDADVIDAALDALAMKYPQYRKARPAGPVVSTVITRWTDWAYRRPAGQP